MTLYDKIIKIHSSLKDKNLMSVGILLQNGGNGDYIAEWNHETLKQPTDKELEAVDVSDVEAENNLNSLRIERNLLLEQSDWVVIKEREEGGSVSNFADWKTYRQELRDITKTYKTLDTVKWPTAPSE